MDFSGNVVTTEAIVMFEQNYRHFEPLLVTDSLNDINAANS